MTANDCLRRLRYILNVDDNAVVRMLAEAGQEVAREQVTAWLKPDDDPAFEVCPDAMLAAFLDALITERRGPRDGPARPPEDRLNNNIVFRKLKIAFDLQAEEILLMLESQDLEISKHELSAFFRRADHKHYRDCKDQVLRNFLMALQLRERGLGKGP